MWAALPAQDNLRRHRKPTLCELLCSLTKQDHADCLREDQHIQHQRVVLDVKQVELQLPLCVLHRRSVGKPDLRPTRNARFDAVAQVIEPDFLPELIDEGRALWTRPDEAHVTVQNVDQLRQLVDAQLAQDTTDPGHACVLCRCPARDAVLLRVNAHRAELQAAEYAPAAADPLLCEEHRRAAFDEYGQDRDDKNRQRQQQNAAAATTSKTRFISVRRGFWTKPDP